MIRDITNHSTQVQDGIHRIADETVELASTTDNVTQTISLITNISKDTSNVILRNSWQTFLQAAMLSLSVFTNRFQSMVTEGSFDGDCVDKIGDYRGSRLGRWYHDIPENESITKARNWQQLPGPLDQLHQFAAQSLRVRLDENIEQEVQFSDKMVDCSRTIEENLLSLNEFAKTLKYEEQEAASQAEEDIFF